MRTVIDAKWHVYATSCDDGFFWLWAATNDNAQVKWFMRDAESLGFTTLTIEECAETFASAAKSGT